MRIQYTTTRLLLFLSFIFSTCYTSTYAQSLGLNNSSPDASSLLDLTATDRGLLVPRMTETQRDAIASPATSLMIYQTDNTAGFYYYDGAAWVEVNSAPPVTEVTATGSITTTSTADVLATTMTITPGAGDYLVMFSTSVSNNGSDVTSFVSIYVNSVQVAHTERRSFTEQSIPNTATTMSTQCYATSVTAGQAIEARWRVSGGTGTMYQRTLTVIKM